MVVDLLTCLPKPSSYVTICSSTVIKLWTPLLLFFMVKILLTRCWIRGGGEVVKDSRRTVIEKIVVKGKIVENEKSSRRISSHRHG